MKGPQRTILFLIADTGAGHRSAANAIRNALQLIAQKEKAQWRQQREQPELDTASQDHLSRGVLEAPTYRVEIVDVFEDYSRFPLREAVKLYGPAIRYRPEIYGQIFHLSNQAQRVLAVKSVAAPLIRNGLLRLITTVQPDVIVSIHPMLNHVTVEALQFLGLKIPFLTVVTDLVSVHYAWFAPGVDSYVVPTEEARQLYLERSQTEPDLSPDRVHVLGMPIDPKFTLEVAPKDVLRRQLGLLPDIPVILLVGGGDGAGGLQSAVHAISQARLPVQLLIITGRNKRLFVHLQRIRSNLRVPTRVFGFVHNMPEMMRASDVIVTKAGPGTICEALACHLPIVLSGYVPGQEEGNVTYVVKNDVGVLAYDSVELINSLRRLIKPGSELLRQQVENATRISRPHASFDIAEYILSFLPAAEKSSIWQTSRGLRAQKPRRTLVRSGSITAKRKIRTRLPRVQNRPGQKRLGLTRPSLRKQFPRLTFFQRSTRHLLRPRSLSRQWSRFTRSVVPRDKPGETPG